MKKRILIEASGSMVSGYLIKAINDSGNESIASDIDSFNHGICLANHFVKVPRSTDPNLWKIIEEKLLINKIDIVIPSFDETLLSWSYKKEYFKEKGINIIVSNSETVEIFLDKYKAYEFCVKNDILTPKTSLVQEFELVKPRFGRGGKDIYIGNEFQDMTNNISQELIKGIEYTVDCFFDKNGRAIYIIPRQRIDVIDGKSTKGIVVKHDLINYYVEKIAKNIKFEGPINFQFIESKNKRLFFIEINPRVAGGMALGFAASENWINLIINNFINNQEIEPKEIKYGLRMLRYYAECFI